MRIDFDVTKTLDILERTDWGSPEGAATPMVEKCLRLRKTPLERLTAGDLRLMLGQQISPVYLVPLALNLLEAEPMLEASYYPGDLLLAVLHQPASFWNEHQRLRQLVDAIFAQHEAELRSFLKSSSLLETVDRYAALAR